MDNQYSFVGGMQGRWRVQDVRPVLGAGLDPVERLDIVAGAIATLTLGNAIQ